MSTYEIMTISILAGGFVLTLGGILVAITRAVDNIKANANKKVAETTERIVAQRTDFNVAIAALEDRFQADQKTQDHNFGEVGLALRQHISDVEKKMYEIEIWVRDHFATKPDISAIMLDIKEMRAEIKQDFRDLTEKLEEARRV
jgi:hypothetical protein